MTWHEIKLRWLLYRAGLPFRKPERKIADARRVLSANPNCAKAWHIIGVHLYQINFYELDFTREHDQEILRHYERAYDLNPGEYKYAFSYIWFLCYAGQKEMAASLLRENKSLPAERISRLMDNVDGFIEDKLTGRFTPSD